MLYALSTKILVHNPPLLSRGHLTGAKAVPGRAEVLIKPFLDNRVVLGGVFDNPQVRLLQVLSAVFLRHINIPRCIGPLSESRATPGRWTLAYLHSSCNLTLLLVGPHLCF